MESVLPSSTAVASTKPVGSVERSNSALKLLLFNPPALLTATVTLSPASGQGLTGEQAETPLSAVVPSGHGEPAGATEHAPQGEQQATGWGQGLGEQAAPPGVSVEEGGQAAAWTIAHAPEASQQGIGQGSVLQGRLSCKAGQTVPPLAAGVMTERVKSWVPPPQGSEQPPEGVQSLTTQSVGQGLGEQESTPASRVVPAGQHWSAGTSEQVPVEGAQQTFGAEIWIRRLGVRNDMSWPLAAERYRNW